MKREENEWMRARILDAVIACKTDAAGTEASLSQIACRAGISERTLNRYFPDKELLLYDAAIRYLERLYQEFAQRYLASDRSGLSGLQQLLALMQMQIERNRSDLTCAKVFVRAYTTTLRTAVCRDLPVAEYDAPIREIVCRCIRDGIQDGSIRKEVVPLDTYLLILANYMGLVQRLIYFYSVAHTREVQRQELLLVFDQYLHMLEIYLRAEGDPAADE